MRKQEAVTQIATYLNSKIDVTIIPFGERIEQRILETLVWGVTSLIPVNLKGIPVQSLVLGFMVELTSSPEVREKMIEFTRTIVTDEEAMDMERQSQNDYSLPDNENGSGGSYWDRPDSGSGSFYNP